MGSFEVPKPFNIPRVLFLFSACGSRCELSLSVPAPAPSPVAAAVSSYHDELLPLWNYKPK